MPKDPAQLSGPERNRQGASLDFRCRQLTATLRDALGADGCSALLGRALDECEPRHPVLKHIRGTDGREIQLAHVSAGIDRYGVDAAEEGIEAVFGSLAKILGRLIGEDMAMRVLDMDTLERNPDEETS